MFRICKVLEHFFLESGANVVKIKRMYAVNASDIAVY